MYTLYIFIYVYPMKDNLLCCRCKRCENRAIREPLVSNKHNDKNQSRLKSKSIGGHFGVRVKHCMCVQFWCLAHLRWGFSSAPIYSCTLTSSSSVTANIPSSRSVEYSSNYVKMSLYLVSYQKLCILMYVGDTYLWSDITPKTSRTYKSRLWNGLILYIYISSMAN